METAEVIYNITILLTIIITVFFNNRKQTNELVERLEKRIRRLEANLGIASTMERKEENAVELSQTLHTILAILNPS